uniref:Riboflavin transporter n=1 Tax=Rhabditophanes sp. KR3021 TaxID=114890 RepID=A0AC35UAC6_9BILA
MTSHLLFAAVVIFGSSTWLATNSIWMQLPLLTQTLPEGWSLPSYLAAIVQVACVAPVIYSIFFKCTQVKINTSYVIGGLILFCSLCLGLASLYWDSIMEFSNTHISLAFMGLVFGMACVNSTSNVLFMPYMASFNPELLNAYFFGMGLSSLVPSIVSLIQGTGRYDCVKLENTTIFTPSYYAPIFSVSTFFGLMGIYMLITLCAFIYINSLNTAPDNDTTKNHPTEEEEINEMTQLRATTDNTTPPNDQGKDLFKFVYQWCMLAFISAQMNSIIPSIQSFASLPYSQSTYHFALTLSMIASPLACILPYYISPPSLKASTILTLISTIASSVIVLFAAYSPQILISLASGSIAVILASIISSSLHAFLRTTLTTEIRNESTSTHSTHSRLFWSGWVIQIGSFVGALGIFPLVNMFSFFQSAQPCSDLNLSY